jgi:hypothetical protein
LSCCAITLCLEKHIYHFTILIDCSPQVVLLTVDLYKYLVNIKSIAVAPMPSLQAPGIFRSEFDTPKANCFAADSDSSLG